MLYFILLALPSILFSLFLVINLIYLDIETYKVYYTKIEEMSKTITLPIKKNFAFDGYRDSKTDVDSQG